MESEEARRAGAESTASIINGLTAFERLRNRAKKNGRKRKKGRNTPMESKLTFRYGCDAAGLGLDLDDTQKVEIILGCGKDIGMPHDGERSKLKTVQSDSKGSYCCSKLSKAEVTDKCTVEGDECGDGNAQGGGARAFPRRKTSEKFSNDVYEPEQQEENSDNNAFALFELEPHDVIVMEMQDGGLKIVDASEVVFVLSDSDVTESDSKRGDNVKEVVSSYFAANEEEVDMSEATNDNVHGDSAVSRVGLPDLSEEIKLESESCRRFSDVSVKGQSDIGSTVREDVETDELDEVSSTVCEIDMEEDNTLDSNDLQVIFHARSYLKLPESEENVFFSADGKNINYIFDVSSEELAAEDMSKCLSDVKTIKGLLNGDEFSIEGENVAMTFEGLSQPLEGGDNAAVGNAGPNCFDMKCHSCVSKEEQQDDKELMFDLIRAVNVESEEDYFDASDLPNTSSTISSLEDIFQTVQQIVWSGVKHADKDEFKYKTGLDQIAKCEGKREESVELENECKDGEENECLLKEISGQTATSEQTEVLADDCQVGGSKSEIGEDENFKIDGVPLQTTKDFSANENYVRDFSLEDDFPETNQLSRRTTDSEERGVELNAPGTTPTEGFEIENYTEIREEVTKSRSAMAFPIARGDCENEGNESSWKFERQSDLDVKSDAGFASGFRIQELDSNSETPYQHEIAEKLEKSDEGHSCSSMNTGSFDQITEWEAMTNEMCGNLNVSCDKVQEDFVFGKRTDEEEENDGFVVLVKEPSCAECGCQSSGSKQQLNELLERIKLLEEAHGRLAAQNKSLIAENFVLSVRATQAELRFEMERDRRRSESVSQARAGSQCSLM